MKQLATTAIVNSIRQRDRLHLQVKKHPQNLKLKDDYVKFINKITNIIKKNAKFFITKHNSLNLETTQNLNGKLLTIL